MKKLTVIKTDLFADEHHRKKIDTLAAIESYIDFLALAKEVDRVTPRPVSAQGGRPPYPTETMMPLLALKRLCNHPENGCSGPERPRNVAVEAERSIIGVGEYG